MDDPRKREILAYYPYVIVRLACPRCHRSGQYRLARLAEKFGAQARLANVVAALTSDCNLRNEAGGHPYRNWCQAYLPDLQKPQPPPDVPPAGLRVISGGRR